ncbi:MAG: single-stranded-DNA-specific exonuclease RecJ [Candidatus Aureabacteria bacterium]|nr:single-stranded-DNA-specific exonuclease RecJ [Candidatus Auribacterota bacterium]
MTGKAQVMKSFQKKTWEMAGSRSQKDIEAFRDDLRCSPLLARVLVSKFGQDIEAAREFLNPRLSNMTDPFSVEGYRDAAERIVRSLQAKEKICIYGDFDMDGLAGTALLYEVLRFFQADVCTYIPNRIDEGYGMHREALETLTAAGIKLMISVDCGIKAVQEVRFLNEKGVDCIITDHHEPGEELPGAFVVLNPKLLGDDHQTRDLAGVGVAFELAYALLKYVREKEIFDCSFDLRTSLDYVALGTIADVVPLTGENRILVSNGLSVLGKTSRKGLRSVMARAKINNPPGPYHVAFLIAPRFNAAGRLGKAHEAFDLLVSQSDEQTEHLSMNLEDYNEERRAMEMQVLSDAEDKLKDDSDCLIPVLEDKSWHTGIIGIVASRLSERWRRPFLLIGSEKDVRRGSGRSYGRFNLIEALDSVSELFENFGGHKAACGFTIREENIEELRRRLNIFAGNCPEDIFESKIFVSDEVRASELSLESLEDLRRLEPFGYGNSRPFFLMNKMKILRSPRVFKDKHVSFELEKEEELFSAIWYNGKEFVGGNAERMNGLSVDVVFQPDVDTYSAPRVILKIEDMAFSEP